MKKLLVWLVVILFSPILYAQSVGENVVFSRLKNNNYYLLDKLAQNASVSEIARESTVFKQLAQERSLQVASRFNTAFSVDTLINAYLWSDFEIQKTTAEWVRLSKKYPEVKAFFSEVKRSQKYANFNQLEEDEFIRKSWQLCLNAINYCLKVYGLGHSPTYAKIDSVAYDVKTEFFKNSVYSWAAALQTIPETYFFDSPLNFSLALLYMNHRDEAVRYPALDTTLNAKAVALAEKKHLHPYASIIILGNGPENYTDKLSALGKLNLYLAVQQFNAGKAPFLIVSGGHVHPNRTPNCEAIEMRKELIEVYGIPEENIIVEPYARHTTTNLRNAARLMINYGIDIGKKSLVITNYGHSVYTASDKFIERCIQELGYVPGEIKSLSPGGVIEFLPNRLVLHQNPFEPLDP